MIVFDKVTKKFKNGSTAIQDLSFHIKPKEFVFITGPSGAGKTTLLKLLLREISPSKGTIHLDKTDINKISKKDIHKLRQQIGAAFQDFKVLSDWTVAENVALGLEILGQTQSQIDKRVAHLLELVGLSDKADLFPSQVSGGELQRTIIARALAPEPKILFADEPTGNLDHKTALQITSLLKDINDLGTTVIMATHDKDAINYLKERLIELDKGKITKDTKPDKKKKSSKK